MILIFLLIISLLLGFNFRISVFDLLFPVSSHFHFLCLQQLPADSNAISELKALVCAENFANLQSSQLYISSGLIHLFVVSGAHLLVLEKIFTDFFQAFFLLLLLTVYAFACGLNPPITRALLAFAVGVVLTYKKINWPAHFRLLIAGLLTLVFNFNWISSFSLQMSWIASMLVVFAAEVFSENSAFFRQSALFFALLPTVIFFQIPSPVGILLNLFLAPLLELVLFPLGLLVGVFNFLFPAFDGIIYLLKALLEKTEITTQLQGENMPLQLTMLNWTFILILQAGFHLYWMKKQRQAI